MECAMCRIKSAGKYKLVYVSELKNGNIDIKEISENITCPFCGALGWIKNGEQKETHFAFAHEYDCPIVTESDTKHKPYVIVTGEVIMEDDILYKNDYQKAKRKLAKNNYNSNEIEEINDDSIWEDDSDEKSNEVLKEIDYSIQEELKKKEHYIDDIDMVKVFKERKIRSPKKLYRRILELGIYEPLLSDGRCGDDVLLDEKHLRDVRKNGIEDGSRKLVIASRIAPSSLKHKIYYPKGYVLLKDMYARDWENAIFFLVKITDDYLNNIFNVEVSGIEEDRINTRDPHHDLLIYGEFRQYPNDFYQVYMTEIGNCGYDFVNMERSQKKTR